MHGSTSWPVLTCLHEFFTGDFSVEILQVTARRKKNTSWYRPRFPASGVGSFLRTFSVSGNDSERADNSSCQIMSSSGIHRSVITAFTDTVCAPIGETR
jgi:hypothetical protein